VTPYVIIIIAAIIGGYLYGIAGFFLWGVLAFGGTLIVGLALQKLSGGILPKQVRVQTAKDFIAERPDLVALAWPSHSASEQAKEIQGLLEAMYRRAITESRSFHLDAPGDLDHFVSCADIVISEQNSDAIRTVARELIAFVLSHPLWYGSARNT
jgi:hypothetical protein